MGLAKVHGARCATKLNCNTQLRPHPTAIPIPVNPSVTPASDPPVFDAQVLKAMFSNDTAVVSSVLGTFLNSTRSSLAELEVAAAAQNWVSVGALAHKLMGACQMSGAQALGNTALAIEDAAKRNDTAALLQSMGKLQTQWTQLQATITDQIRNTDR